MKIFDIYPAKPFVKWAGGKKQLLGEIKNLLPCELSQRREMTYIEPFVGGGAVLFWILQEYPNINRAVINDINTELICTYKVVRNDVENLIDELARLQSAYLPLDDVLRKEFFIVQRERYNKKNISDVETAALFIFLNRTCFNGLYRVNTKGEFNVPHGRYANPRICDEETLRADSALLQRVKILGVDFSQTGKFATDNVIYYLDPPYRPLSETSSFTSYSKESFDDAEQTRLRDFCEQISKRGSLFVASNSDPLNVDSKDYFFDRLYQMFSIRRVFATRMINSKVNCRGAVSEIMVSNIF